MTDTRTQDELSTGLRNRHVTMISIAGVIGAGLFVGSGEAIATAGPGVLLAYLFAGALVVLVMRMLGEMAAAQPDSGSFSTYADRAIGSWAGFTVGWLYWWFWVLVTRSRRPRRRPSSTPTSRPCRSGCGRSRSRWS